MSTYRIPSSSLSESPIFVGSVTTVNNPISNTIGSKTIADPYIYVQGGIGYTNSYVNFAAAGYQESCYYKDGRGIVHVVVCCKNGTESQSMFTLPVGYRPTRDIVVAAYINGVQNFVVFSGLGDVTQLLAGVTTGGILCVASFPGLEYAGGG